MADEVTTEQKDMVDPARRRALARLGLGVAVAYTAPSLLRVERTAHAQFASPSTECPPGDTRPACGGPGGPPAPP